MSGSGLSGVVGEEAAHVLGDGGAVVFEGEVAGVEEVKLGVGQVAQVGVGAFGGENGIVFAPDDEGGGLVLAEVLLPGGVEGGIASVVVEQGELDGLVAGAIEQALVDVPVVGADGFGVAHAVGVLPPGGFEGEQAAEGVGVFVGAVGPVGLDGKPELAKAFGVGVAVLDDEGLDAIGVSGGEAEANGGAVVHEVEGVGIEAEGVGELFDDVGEVVEGVVEVGDVGHGAVPEAGVVGCDDVVAIGEGRDEVSEHV